MKIKLVRGENGLDTIELSECAFGGIVSVYTDDSPAKIKKVEKQFHPNWIGISIEKVVITVEAENSSKYSFFLKDSILARRNGKTSIYKIEVDNGKAIIKLVESEHTSYGILL